MLRSNAMGWCLIHIAAVRQNVNTVCICITAVKQRTQTPISPIRAAALLSLTIRPSFYQLRWSRPPIAPVASIRSTTPAVWWPSFITRDPNTCTTRSGGERGDFMFGVFSQNHLSNFCQEKYFPADATSAGRKSSRVQCDKIQRQYRCQLDTGLILDNRYQNQHFKVKLDVSTVFIWELLLLIKPLTN